MNAEFDWWLLLVGIVGGAALVWLVVGDMRRHDDDLADDERRLEAEWIADAFQAAGRDVDPATVAEVLELHRAYLAGPAPELDPEDETPTEHAGVTGAPAAEPAREGSMATRPRQGPAAADGTAQAALGGRVAPDIDPAVADSGSDRPDTSRTARAGDPARRSQTPFSGPAPGPGAAQPRRAPGDGS